VGLFDWGALDAVIAVLLSLAASTPAVAETVHVVPGVRIERDRLETRGRLPTAFVTELDAADAPRLGLAELLTRAAGVRVQQYGGLGAFSTVSLRGAPAGQVTVLLDGVPLASAAHGAANLADLPVGGV
jgi:iron complex outermembrane receptor protein